MIETIGSLVQETSNRWRWLLSASLYTIACLGTAMLLGTILGALGHLIRGWVHGAAVYALFPHAGAWLIGLLALAYAVSDVGLLRLPRPTLRQAVPITWWRWWRPYGHHRMVFQPALQSVACAAGTGCRADHVRHADPRVRRLVLIAPHLCSR